MIPAAFGFALGIVTAGLLYGALPLWFLLAAFGFLCVVLVTLWCIDAIERAANPPPRAPRSIPLRQPPAPRKRRYYTIIE